MPAASTKRELPPAFGHGDEPRRSEAGEFWAELVDNEDGTFTARSTGGLNDTTRSVEVVVQLESESIYDHAIFAGNSSRDRDYSLELGGAGNEADEISGDVCSGGNIVMAGDATVDGSLTAPGSIIGSTGLDSSSLPLPDIDDIDYPVNQDVDVAALFSSGDEVWQAEDAGGSAWQLPEDNHAQIFRKNPTDRSNVLCRNGKDDHFLKVPTSPS